MARTENPILRRFAALALLLWAMPSLAAEECSTASRFGADDQIGNLNLITPEKTLAAHKLVKTGKTYGLGIETNRATPAYPPRSFAITVVQPGQIGGSLGQNKATYNDDIISGWAGIGSQIDGLGHIGIDGMYFNCNRAADFVKTDGLRKLGVETIPAIATRGVVLDMASYFKTDIVKEGTAFNRKEIEGAVKRQGLESIGEGDVVLFHTGWTQLIGKDDARYASVEPGLGVEGAEYLAAKGVAMVGADSWGVEAVPFETEGQLFRVHQILLAENGIFLLENMKTYELVADKAWEFLFTLGASRITGAVQAIVNPVATR